MAGGELGFVHSIRAQTHDQAPPHAAYIPTSGGLFRDCSIHDFDIIRFVTGREVASVYATGANKGEAFFTEAGDVDTAAAVLTLDDGTLVSLSATRYNGAGHDVRMEVLGSEGTIGVGYDDSLAVTSAEPGATYPSGPRHWSFMERFLPAYRAELTAFAAVARGALPARARSTTPSRPSASPRPASCRAARTAPSPSPRSPACEDVAAMTPPPRHPATRHTTPVRRRRDRPHRASTSTRSSTASGSRRCAPSRSSSAAARPTSPSRGPAPAPDRPRHPDRAGRLRPLHPRGLRGFGVDDASSPPSRSADAGHLPDMKIDRLTSAILEYPSGQCVFSCSMQLVPYQRMHLLGTRGRIELEIPFNAPPDRPTRLCVDDGSSLFGDSICFEEFAVCDQYTIQGDLFSRAIQEDGPVPVSLEDAVRNMAAIDAIFRSAKSGAWEQPVL